MKKIFECSNGVEFFTDGESILGTLSEEEAKDFLTSIAIDAAESEDEIAGLTISMLLRAIDKSYIQLPKVVEIVIILI